MVFIKLFVKECYTDIAPKVVDTIYVSFLIKIPKISEMAIKLKIVFELCKLGREHG